MKSPGLGVSLSFEKFDRPRRGVNHAGFLVFNNRIGRIPEESGTLTVGSEEPFEVGLLVNHYARTWKSVIHGGCIALWSTKDHIRADSGCACVNRSRKLLSHIVKIFGNKSKRN